jgi:hypothetical protein
MDAAVASLLGAIIGGMIGSGSNFGLDTMRSSRQRRRDLADELREARRAARLLAAELESGLRLLVRDKETGTHTWEPPERQLPASAWTEFRADFARVASDQVWDAVACAYADFDQLNWHVRAVIEEDHWTGAEPQHPMESRKLGPRSAELVGSAIGDVDAALVSLREVMTPDAPGSRAADDEG